jgi:hypothetical protein
LKSLICLAIASAGTTFSCAADATPDLADSTNNPWRSLSETTRSDLLPLLSPEPHHSIFKNEKFSSWYHTYYCPGTSLASWKCPVTSPKPKEVYAEFYYNTSRLEQRITSACLAIEIKRDFLDHLPAPPNEIASVTFGDEQGALIIHVSDAETIRKDLMSVHYVTDFCAGPEEAGVKCPEGGAPKIWGLRYYQAGKALHWYQTLDDVNQHKIEVHIDYYGPGAAEKIQKLQATLRNLRSNEDAAIYDTKQALVHTYEDLVKWNDRNLVEVLNSQPVAHCGIGKKDVDYAYQTVKDNKPESVWTELFNKLPASVQKCLP